MIRSETPPKEAENQTDASGINQAFLGMYEIPGHGKLDGQNLKRYSQSKKVWERRIRDRADALRNIRNVKDAPEQERGRLIREAAKDPATEVRKEAVEMIQYLPDDERADFIRTTLKDSAFEVRRAAAGAIKFVPYSEQAGLSSLVLETIREALNNPVIEAWKEAAKMIRYAPEDLRADLIRESLNNPAIEVQQEAVADMLFVPEKERAGLSEKISVNIRKASKNPAVEVRLAAIRMVQFAPVKERSGFIREALNDPAVEVRKEAVKRIMSAPADERVDLIREALNDPAVEVRKEAAKRIVNASANEQADLIREALNDPAVEVQIKAAEFIQIAPAGEQAEFRRIVAEKIPQALSSQVAYTRKSAASLIQYVSKKERAGIFEQVKVALGDELVEPPLYGSEDMGRFSRKPFAKTGSSTTLLGGSLKDKVIVRHISPEAFLGWQSLYEDHESWRKHGFDYVPIEPIAAFRMQKDGQVAVFSGVLDLSLDMWKDMTPQFVRELDGIRDRIMAVLEEKGIRHGHAHEANFCLRFWRDEDGHVDFSKTPRLYLIDFDQTVSP